MSTLPKTIHADDLAEIEGVTVRWLRQRATDGVIPQATRAEYPLKETLIALRLARMVKETPASERKLKAEASILERKDRREAGETIEADQVFKAWENITLVFRQRVLRIGNNVQSKAGLSDHQRKSVDQECADAFRELEKKLNYFAEQEEEEEKPAKEKTE